MTVINTAAIDKAVGVTVACAGSTLRCAQKTETGCKPAPHPQLLMQLSDQGVQQCLAARPDDICMTHVTGSTTSISVTQQLPTVQCMRT
jgi:hypothetical protein